jgi:hypothetical protein
VLYDISHKTTFSYEEMVSVSHHVLHLSPRWHPHQTCIASTTVVEPKPAVDSVGEDYFGNPIQPGRPPAAKSSRQNRNCCNRLAQPVQRSIRQPGTGLV